MEAMLGHCLVVVCVTLLLLWVLLKWGRFRRQHVKDLHHKAVLITGCTGDFGFQLTKRLDSLGVTVYAGVRSPDGAAATRLKEACSSRLKIVQLDVTRDDHVAEAVKTVTSTLGDKKLWAVVNNAGIASYGGFEWTPMETVKKILDTNTIGPIRLTKAFLPLLKESRGRVVIVASIAGHYSVMGISAYNMSKHALVAFGDTIRRELKRWSVSVHLIKPYAYRTNINDPELLCKQMMSNWETANDSKSSYPSAYLNDFKKLLAVQLSISKSEKSVCEVIDDIEDATIGLYPKVSYFPGITAKVLHFIFNLCPDCVIDWVSSIIAPPTGGGDRNRTLDFLYAIVSKK